MVSIPTGCPDRRTALAKGGPQKQPGCAPAPKGSPDDLSVRSGQRAVVLCVQPPLALAGHLPLKVENLVFREPLSSGRGGRQADACRTERVAVDQGVRPPYRQAPASPGGTFPPQAGGLHFRNLSLQGEVAGKLMLAGRRGLHGAPCPHAPTPRPPGDRHSGVAGRRSALSGFSLLQRVSDGCVRDCRISLARECAISLRVVVFWAVGLRPNEQSCCACNPLWPWRAISP